jgi:hypothetical protein
MIARVLQYMYHGEYDVLNVATGLTRLLQNAALDVHPDEPTLPQRSDFEVHADVYAMGDRLEIPSLKAVSAAHFVSEQRSKNFSIADLVSAIDIVYAGTPDTGIGLRKWVVYRAQQFAHDLVRHDDFKNAFKEHLDFAWDYATKYARANYLWCSHCKATVDLVECRCGFFDMCGDPLCATENSTALRCTNCELWGKLLRDVPQLKENLTLRELARTDGPEAPIKRSPKKKRRFS